MDVDAALEVTDTSGCVWSMSEIISSAHPLFVWYSPDRSAVRAVSPGLGAQWDAMSSSQRTEAERAGRTLLARVGMGRPEDNLWLGGSCGPGDIPAQDCVWGNPVSPVCGQWSAGVALRQPLRSPITGPDRGFGNVPVLPVRGIRPVRAGRPSVGRWTCQSSGQRSAEGVTGVGGEDVGGSLDNDFVAGVVFGRVGQERAERPGGFRSAGIPETGFWTAAVEAGTPVVPCGCAAAVGYGERVVVACAGADVTAEGVEAGVSGYVGGSGAGGGDLVVVVAEGDQHDAGLEAVAGGGETVLGRCCTGSGGRWGLGTRMCVP